MTSIQGLLVVVFLFGILVGIFIGYEIRRVKMSNMAYCRFENTLPDLQDCADALDNYGTADLSESERTK